MSGWLTIPKCKGWRRVVNSQSLLSTTAGVSGRCINAKLESKFSLHFNSIFKEAGSEGLSGSERAHERAYATMTVIFFHVPFVSRHIAVGR